MEALAAGQIEREDRGFRYWFRAMGSPCEVRIDSADECIATEVGLLVEREAQRIESKFSRYLPDNIIAKINLNAGSDVSVDDETARLLDYASQCYTATDGRFDITSGVLRAIWQFDGSDRVPDQSAIDRVLKRVGWSKAKWQRPVIRLAPGMELDFGGLGKEYAVDSAISLIRNQYTAPILVNFGGDLRVTGPRSDGTPWKVAIESINLRGTAAGLLDLHEGALATSGDNNRYLLKDGVRYGHILDPRTGWPVKYPPRSVTVAAPTCIEAGSLSTFAMLEGKNSERFLRREKVMAWCIRE